MLAFPVPPAVSEIAAVEQLGPVGEEIEVRARVPAKLLRLLAVIVVVTDVPNWNTRALG